MGDPRTRSIPTAYAERQRIQRGAKRYIASTASHWGSAARRSACVAQCKQGVAVQAASAACMATATATTTRLQVCVPAPINNNVACGIVQPLTR